MKIIMKKAVSNLLFTITVALAGIASFSSCNDDNDEPVPGFYFNTCLKLYVENESGQNLLDPANPENLIRELEAFVYYDGKQYPLQWNDADNENSCAYHQGRPDYSFYGIWYEPHALNNHLEVGIFNGYLSWQKNFSIEFPKYGKTYQIEWNNNGGKDQNKTVKVNGETIPASEFTVVL